MEAPVCRLCKTRHWPADPHRFSGDDTGARTASVSEKASESVRADCQPDSRSAAILKGGGADRRDYMRDYMRRWRAQRGEAGREAHREYMRRWRTRRKGG